MYIHIKCSWAFQQHFTAVPYRTVTIPYRTAHVWEYRTEMNRPLPSPLHLPPPLPDPSTPPGAEGGGRGGWGSCGRRTEPNRTGPHDTEVNRGKPKPDRTEPNRNTHDFALYTHMYIYIYTYMYVYICTYTHTYTHIYMNIKHTYVYVHIYDMARYDIICSEI